MATNGHTEESGTYPIGNGKATEVSYNIRIYVIERK